MIPRISGSAYQRHVERAHHELAGREATGSPMSLEVPTGRLGRGGASGAAERSGPAGLHLAGLRLAGMIRDVVAESWERSLAVHARPDSAAAPAVLAEDELLEARRGHPLASVLPIIRRLLVEPAADAGLIVAVGNAHGHLLWVEGDPVAGRRAEAMGFVPGADWSESSLGTSAPGTALVTGRPVQVSRAEHFHPVVHPWSCSAVPLRDPSDGSLVGVLDLTGGDDAVSPLSLPLLGATASAVETAWQRHGVHPGGWSRPTPVPGGSRGGAAAADESAVPRGNGPVVLRVTGGLPPRLVTAEAAPGREVSGRHAEILTLLDWNAPGLDGAALEDLLYGSRRQEATLRAELHRLRRMLAAMTGSVAAPEPDAGRTDGEPSAGALGLESRPYRITGPLCTDAALARAALRRGDLEAALHHAVGPVLPRSEAPGIREIRQELQADLREAVLQDAGLEQLWAYLGRPEAAGDLELWSTALRLLPADSPRRALAVSTIERITADG